MRFFGLVLLFGFAAVASAGTNYQQMFVFGDSYSDTGAGYIDGNGPTAVAYLAQDLGIVLTPSNKGTSPQQSLNFAVSGAQTGSGDGKKMGDAFLGYGMQNQVNDFAREVKSGKIQFQPGTTLFFLAGGLNDSHLRTETTVEDLENEIRQLYALGGRHFRVALMPTAIPTFSEVGARLNPALAKIPEQLKGEMAGADIALSHWGPFFDEVMRNPARYDIKNTKDACAGREISKEDTTPCATPESYYYYHSGHPSTAVHKIVGKKLAEEIR